MLKQGPVIGEFELVADSVEALRQLIAKLSEAPVCETSTPSKKSRVCIRLATFIYLS